jgi:hypothetical protein
MGVPVHGQACTGTSSPGCTSPSKPGLGVLVFPLRVRPPRGIAAAGRGAGAGRAGADGASHQPRGDSQGAKPANKHTLRAGRRLVTPGPQIRMEFAIRMACTLRGKPADREFGLADAAHPG